VLDVLSREAVGFADDNNPSVLIDPEIPL